MRDAIVPVLVDASRSMSLEDADGARRIDRARDMVDRDLLPALAPAFTRRSCASASGWFRRSRRRSRRPIGARASGRRCRRSASAIADVPSRASSLLSDGGDNGDLDAAVEASGGPPVYAIGIGPKAVSRDREVVGVTATESVLADALVDISVAAVSHGYGRTPFELRLLENGRPVDLRRVTPAADGVPVSERFHVSPSRDVPTVYTVEIPAGAGRDRRRRTTPAASSCRLRRAADACCSSKGRRASSTAF